MNRVTNQLIHKGYLKTDSVIDAFAEIPRAEFVPSRLRVAAEADIPIPIGHGVMIPATSVVAYMVELLQAQKGNHVLIAGYGSGWFSALLSFIVGFHGHVTSIGRSEALKKQVVSHIGRFGFIARDHIVDTYIVEDCADIPDASYDRIIIFDEYYVQCDLVKKLNLGGILVAPIDNVITLFSRTAENGLTKRAFSGMTFFPKNQ